MNLYNSGSFIETNVFGMTTNFWMNNKNAFSYNCIELIITTAA